MTFYAHLSSWTVKEGQEVKKGEIIGYTGATGFAGGDHLHFAVMLSGYPVDPVEWFDQKWLNERILLVVGLEQ
jgi:murein DD-endopeptidase MepM/ murein hydrolase activator NlpD